MNTSSLVGGVVVCVSALLAGCSGGGSSGGSSSSGGLSASSSSSSSSSSGSSSSGGGSSSSSSSSSSSGSGSGSSSSSSSSSSGAATISWTPLGPGGASNSGRVDTIAKDPITGTLLIGGPGDTGIYRSTDDGRTWHAANTGLKLGNGLIDSRIRRLWFSPGPVSLALAGTLDGGIYRSTDGGQTWSNVYRTTEAVQFAAVGATIYAATDGGLLASADSGKTWSISLAGSTEDVTSVAGSTLAVQGTRLYSLAGGAWKQVSTLPAWGCQVHIDPLNTSVLYAALSGGYNCELYASLDGGLSFNKVAYHFLGMQAIAFSSHYPHQVYVAGDGAAGWIAADGNPDPTYHGVAMGTDTRNIHIEPNAAGTDDRCYTATDQGVYIVDPCSNGGSTGRNAGLVTNWITGFAVSADEQSIIAMVQDYSAYASNDAGKTWHSLPIGEDGTAAFHPTNPLACYGFNGALYVSTDGCKTVKKTVSYGSPVTQADDIAFDPKAPGTMYLLGGTSSGNVLVVSTDGGTSFSPTGWPLTSPTGIRVDPRDGQHVLVETASGLQLSFDGGKTWAAASGGPTSASFMAIDPADGNIVMQLSGGAVVYLSHDGGKTFSKGTTISGAASIGTIDINDKGYVAVATADHGLYLSKDFGHTWARLDGPSGKLISHKFWAAQWRNGTLYVASYGQGIFKSSVPVQ